MSRAIIEINFRKSKEETEKQIEYFLIQNDFKKILYNGIEEVWKKGTGLATAMQYIKPEFENGVLKISAWVQVGVGNFGGKEMNLDGFTAVIPKKSLKKTIEKLKEALR